MSDAAILRDILRVDHAGEAGAIRIYGAQIRVARLVAPDLLPMLRAALTDEIAHREAFENEMRHRGIVACHMLPFWWVGGALLGFFTALLGRNAILTCTEAVERTVHRHMNDQIAWLEQHDMALMRVIAAIRDQEVDHLDKAVAVGGVRPRWLERLIAGTTEALVWLSTYGASARLARALR
ncbi:MAG: demethoxyubiquinone hydroxylase family protein [Sphingomonas sp.]